MKSVADLRVKLFADGADAASMIRLAANPLIRGFTTNPSLMRKAGIAGYEGFARQVLCAIRDAPVSFEVLSDDFKEMERQARKIAAWGANVYVKIPVTNTSGASSAGLVRRLSGDGLKLNVTAVMSLDQARKVNEALAGDAPAIVSIFAGRIADTGRDPAPIMSAAAEMLAPRPHIELLWASPREVLNIFQADAAGCHIITVTNDLLAKLSTVGKDLDEFSRETVRMFYEDGRESGYEL
ncbi:MAG: transaldolase [Bryobacteraceae bacterium]|nr:transaldolase [Bryobacteraceae bacterium]